MLIPSRLRLPLRPSWLQRAGAAIAWGRSLATRRGLDPSSNSDSAFDLETEDGSDASEWDYVQPGSAQTTLDEFEGFFRAHEARLSAYLWRMTGDRQSASDLCQETFLRAWQRFGAIRAYDRPDAWLFRVATNLALQLARRKKAPVGAAGPLDEAFEPSMSDPAWRLAERDLVRETLLELPPRARSLLILREVSGFSAEEAAQTLGMSLSAVKVALWRARAQFREVYLRKEGRS
ncbi:MAG TPA: RNA polymerase sigma factor [Ktedonobacterales bacterium]